MVEVVVAITLLAAVFVLLAGLFSSMLINTVFARQNQQAIDLISEQIERIRSGVYEDTALRPSDIGGDCKIVLVGTQYRYDSDCGGPAAPTEPVVLSATGTIFPHVSTAVRNNVTFTLTRYVTTATDIVVTDADYRRVVVHAQWRENGRRRDREASTLLSLNRRGLPLPKFSYRTAVTKTVNQGATLVLPGRIVNNGARDRFNLTAAASGRSWAFRFYEDLNGNGQKDPSDTTELVDTDADGTRDTGLMETDGFKNFVVVYTTASNELLEVAVPVTRTATSAVGATASTGTVTLTDKVTVATQPCTGCTLVRSYLRSGGLPGADTLATIGMPMDALASTAGALPNYDTDVDSVPGRTVARASLAPCGSGCPPGSAETDPAKVASWRFGAPNDMTITGDLSVNLWMVMKDLDATKNVNMVVYVRSEDSAGAFGVRGSKTFSASPLGLGVFGLVEVRVPVNFVVAKDRHVEVRVLVDTGSNADLWLAYDTADYASHVVLPVVAGA